MAIRPDELVRVITAPEVEFRYQGFAPTDHEKQLVKVAAEIIDRIRDRWNDADLADETFETTSLVAQHEAAAAQTQRLQQDARRAAPAFEAIEAAGVKVSIHRAPHTDRLGRGPVYVILERRASGIMRGWL